MKKRQLINEIMGVPKAVDAWVTHISTIVTILIDDIIDGDQWMSSELE